MRILVTGSEGQVASSLREVAPDNFEMIFAGRPQLDLANAASIERAVAAAQPDFIISAAAYTAVDQAEDEEEIAFAVNADGPAVLAQTARNAGIPILHLSTDYVFDGTSDRPYRENDPVSPLGAYGRSKRAGEEAIQKSGADYLIMRTAWVYSPFGHNFVKTMLRVAQGRDSVTVVDDQIGCPTSAHDIAEALLLASSNWRKDMPKGGIFHFVGSGEASWADFAKETFRISASLGGPSAEVQAISTSDWPTKAARPANSRLNCDKFAQTFEHRGPAWEKSLRSVVSRLV